MKKEITLGGLLSILVPLFVLILGWGVSINSRLDVTDSETQSNKEYINKNRVQIEKTGDKIDENFKIIQEKLDRILFRELNN
jgi:hypothetical protein